MFYVEIQISHSGNDEGSSLVKYDAMFIGKYLPICQLFADQHGVIAQKTWILMVLSSLLSN